MEKLSGVGDTQLMQISGVAFGYSCLLFTEGVGLWLQKRWAEYLTAIATSLFIPLELYEIYERFTWVRIGILALNIFIVWYLVTRLKDEKKEVLATKHTERSEKDRVKVKICGITGFPDALYAVEKGADAIGFNFYTGSKRYISPLEAESICERLTVPVFRIGVFVNASTKEIVDAAGIVGLDAIQLHGDETPEFIEKLRAQTDSQIIKAIRVETNFEPNDVLKYKADAILLDAFSNNERGGTGKTIDWTIAGQVAEIVDELYLAGGLTPENVAEAIKIVQPYAVDVASGVESSPGKKDPKKVAAFIKAAKEAI